MIKPRWIFITLLLLLSPDVLAQTAVKFTNTELAAGTVLMRPELNSLELDDQAGIFTPGPSLLALGIAPLKFDIDFTGLSDLANIHFDHLKGSNPSLRFEGTDIVVSVPIEDKSRGIRSLLGAVNFKNVVLKARVAWRLRTDGTPELYLRKTEAAGSITGTGVLRPGFMVGLVKKLLLSTVGKQVTRIINQGQVHDAILTGLLMWAKFSTGQEWKNLIPNSVEFYTDGGESGLRYQVQ
ncbi:MAG: hypothetical protein JST80_00605 [Bdellovibrionales bacterium]|nr:hypothetical protein [Bdellovibrionales bacterium]